MSRPAPSRLMRAALSQLLLIYVLLAGASCSSRGRTDANRGSWYPEEILTPEECRQETDEKVARIVRWMKATRRESVSTLDPRSVEWLTGGAVSLDRRIWVQIWEDRREIWSPDWDVQRLRNEAFAGAGWTVKDQQDDPDLSTLLPEFTQFRDPLTPQEIRKYRWLGKRAAEAVESVCAGLERWMTERGIEALVSDELMRRAIRPAQIRVASDERIERYRLPPPAEKKKVERWALIRVVAERWALQVSLTRIVHFGPLPQELQRKLRAAARVNAVMWSLTRPGGPPAAPSAMSAMEAVVRAAGTAYRDAGCPGEESLQIQKAELVPSSASLFAWTPGVMGVTLEDTVLLDGDNLVVLTQTHDWPRIEASAGGRTYRVPSILVR